MDLRRTVAPAVALAALSLAVAAGFTRLVRGDAWLPLVLLAAVLPHAIGLATRRTRAWVQVGAWAFGLAAFVTWAIVPATTRAGVPTADTLDEIGHRLDTGLTVLRDHGAPVPAATGVVLLAVIAVWVMAAAADVLAFRRSATIGALTPAVTVFIWIAALAPGASHAARAAAAVVVTSAAFLALWYPELRAAQRAPVGHPRRGATTQRLLGGVALAIAAAGVAALVAPSLPGAGADPIVDLRDDDSGSSTYQTKIPPLVDVADNLQRGDRVELFTVVASEPQYWRTVALDQYSDASGGQWTLRASGGDIDHGLSGRPRRGALVQDFQIGALSERWMPAAFAPVSVSRADTLVVADSLTLVTNQPSVTGLRYRVQSVTPAAELTEAQRRATAAAPPPALDRYTALPEALPPEIAEQAREVTAGATTAYDRAVRLRDFFRGSTFTYDTTVDLGDASSATVRFLQIRRGFCVQFASAYALMARAVGIPSRVAVGYTPGELDRATGRYRVSNFEAHAWPEVWLPGIGWTNRFEPTPPSSAAGGSELPGDDAPIAATPPAAVDQPLETPGSATPVPATAAPSPAGAVPAPVEDAGGGSRSVVWMALLAVVVVTTLIAVIPVTKARRRAARRRRADPAARVAGAWEEALDRLNEIGEPPPVSTTPTEVAGRVLTRVGPHAADALGELAEMHTAAQFGPGPVSTVAADLAWDDLGEFRRALREHLGLRQRVRAQFSPVRHRRGTRS